MFRPLLLAAALCVFAAPALAQETASEPSRLKLGLGYFDVFDDSGAADVKVELHSSREWAKIHPWIGLEANTDGGIWGGFGFAADLDLSEQWVFTPSTSVGLWHEGDSKDLGGAVEFRSGAELAYKFGGGHRLGLEITHMSNASIYDENPGAEVISLNYHLPLNAFGQ